MGLARGQARSEHTLARTACCDDAALVALCKNDPHNARCPQTVPHTSDAHRWSPSIYRGAPTSPRCAVATYPRRLKMVQRHLQTVPTSRTQKVPHVLDVYATPKHPRRPHSPVYLRRSDCLHTPHSDGLQAPSVPRVFPNSPTSIDGPYILLMCKLRHPRLLDGRHTPHMCTDGPHAPRCPWGGLCAPWRPTDDAHTS